MSSRANSAIAYFVLVLLLSMALVTRAADERSLVLRNATSNGQSAARIALVIGNGGYTQGPLRNPVNDAKDMAAALQEAGFDVTLVTNADLGRMHSAVRAFGELLLNSKGVGLFYYAGHGMQVAGQNYLMPIGADIAHEDEVPFRSYPVGEALAKMERAGNPLNIVILDACRNNPVERSFRDGAAGLAKMDAPSGTVIAYSTRPGQVAADGSGRNSPFAKALMTAMKAPGVKWEEMYKRVVVAVEGATSRHQTPWLEGVMKGDFYFYADQAAVSSQTTPSPITTTVTADAKAQELAYWNGVSADSIALNRAYLERCTRQEFPCTFQEIAEARISLLNRPRTPEELKTLIESRAHMFISALENGSAAEARQILTELKRLLSEAKTVLGTKFYNEFSGGVQELEVEVVELERTGKSTYKYRQRVTEGLSLASAAKTAVAEYFAANGELPKDNAAAGLPSPEEIMGHSVGSVTVSDGAVTVLFTGDEIGQETMVLTPNSREGGIQWSCVGGSLPAKFRPSTCR